MLTKKFTAGIPKLLPCALLVLAMASAAAQAGMHSGTFHLAAQTLDKALAAYASTTGIHLRIEAAIPAGTNAKSLHGTLTDAEALRQLLVGSGLGYRFVDAHTVVISAVPQQIAQAGVTQLGTLRVEGEGVQYLWGDASAAGNRALNRTMADHPYTTPGSSKVEVSPKLATSPSAIFLKMRRMILPLRVFGSPVTNCILSGLAMAPIIFETVRLISCLLKFSSPLWPLYITKA